PMQMAFSRFEYRGGLTDVATERGAAGTAHARQVVQHVARQIMAVSAAHSEGGTTALLSRFAALTRYDDLPGSVVLQAKQSILDTIGAALAGSGVGEGCNEIVAFASAQSEGGGATLWASGARLGIAQAALANAVHARALDYDDIIEFPQVHVAVCVVPAVFAVSQISDATVTGKAFLAAVAVGCEIQSRLASAIAQHGGGGGMPRVPSTQLVGH